MCTELREPVSEDTSPLLTPHRDDGGSGALARSDAAFFTGATASGTTRHHWRGTGACEISMLATGFAILARASLGTLAMRTGF